MSYQGLYAIDHHQITLWFFFLRLNLCENLRNCLNLYRD